MMKPSRHELTAIRGCAAIAGALPWGAGQFRLAHRYATRGRWPAGSTARQRMRSGVLADLDLSDRTQLLSFLLRDYGPDLTNYVVRRIPQGGTFFDVGGNVGLVSFTVAVHRPDVAIHAFEPNPVNAAAWRRNRELNDAVLAHLTEVGLSDREGHAKFAIPSDSGSGMLHENGDLTVPITTLDHYCERAGVVHIDVLKIDVQGLEPAVLRGAETLLSRGAIGTVVCEICEPLLRIAGEDKGAMMRALEDHDFHVVPIPAAGLRRLMPATHRRKDDDFAFER